DARGRALVSLGRAPEAVAILSASEDVPGLLTLGAALYAQMKWVEAREAFQKAAELSPENAKVLTNLGLARARTAADWEGVELALEMLAKAREMDPLNYFLPPLGQGFAEMRRARPGDADATRYLTRSVTYFQTAVEALPGDPYAHYILARSYLRDGLYDQARKEFRNALVLDFRFSDALLGAGTANLRLGEWKPARALLERFTTVELRTFEREADARAKETARRGALLGLYRQARAWIQSEDMDEGLRLDQAKKLLEELKKMDSRYVPALNGLGYLHYGLGSVEIALNHFEEVLQLAPKDSEHYRYADECIRLITEHSGRRRWLETFDRPNSQRVGNRWIQAPKAGVEIAPRIEDGKAVIAGRWIRNVSNVWLYHGDPEARGRSQDRLNNKFLRARAVLTTQDDRVATQFLIFVLPARGGDIVTALGFERNARGEIVIVRRKTGDRNKKWLEQPVTDEDGNKMMWPEGPVELEIERVDPKKGVFAMYVNGARVADVELGLKRSQGSLSVGFKLTGTAGKSFRTEIDEVEIELYVD
ncbi:MAG: tetratricopeptide repeat protein, partial [Planctomycetota bacterium]